MNRTQPATAQLRQVPTENLHGRRLLRYRLRPDRPVVIGRETDCHLRLSSTHYSTVSRYHAELRPHRIPAPIPGQDDRVVWQIQDLDTQNGTYVNGELIAGWHELRPGDRIRFSRSGPEFVFEQEPTPAMPSQSDRVTITQLIPLWSSDARSNLVHKAYLIPGIITVLFVVGMFATVNQPVLFKQALAVYVTAAAYYVIYQLCGKQKPWWLPIGVAACMVLLLLSPVLTIFTWVFREILPGGVPDNPQSLGFLPLLVRMFFGAGLMEELLKILPLVAVFWLGTQLRSPYREVIGLWEPLDGIILGTASAAGFILFETLGQYVPMIVQQGGEQQGIQILIPRVLGSVAGHMAYSGYFGYFVGLSVQKPSQRWSVLTVGCLSAAGLHALWNAAGFFNSPLLAIVGILSYACLAAAILKARKISTTRQHNFATRLRSGDDR
ncbi:MAG: PrsW family glutamic-type intramembrane protease [Cyanobacteria bacterium]|nr:PrsW family glutamic-type intramembrane protease [Cyanobacteriota bacterium]MDW8199831.1 PrsW family glutamic-type intramembrane protease [Cyanobacteriota bacterium SKYGB_h_bin112]